MHKKDSNNIQQKIEDKIINVAYGDASIVDKLYVKWKIWHDKDLKKLFTEYRNTALTVHKLHQKDLPEQTVDFVISKTIRKEKKKNILQLISVYMYELLGRKLIPAAVFSLAVIIMISIFILRDPANQNKYSNAQIELAEKQFKQTLAIVGKAFNKAESSFNNEIMEKQVNKKLNKGYYLINNILIGG
jgi:hypothetical protein